MRHAAAERGDAASDRDRRLTGAGRRAFAMLAVALAAEMRVKAVLASPFLRARETASILAEAVGAPLEDREMLGAGQSTGAGLLRLGREAGEGAALVGHNPEVAEAIALAAGASRTVPPGTVAAVEADDVGYRLLWLRSP